MVSEAVFYRVYSVQVLSSYHSDLIRKLLDWRNPTSMFLGPHWDCTALILERFWAVPNLTIRYLVVMRVHVPCAGGHVTCTCAVCRWSCDEGATWTNTTFDINETMRLVGIRTERGEKANHITWVIETLCRCIEASRTPKYGVRTYILCVCLPQCTLELKLFCINLLDCTFGYLWYQAHVWMRICVCPSGGRSCRWVHSEWLTDILIPRLYLCQWKVLHPDDAIIKCVVRGSHPACPCAGSQGWFNHCHQQLDDHFSCIRVSLR